VIFLGSKNPRKDGVLVVVNLKKAISIFILSGRGVMIGKYYEFVFFLQIKLTSIIGVSSECVTFNEVLK